MRKGFAVVLLIVSILALVGGLIIFVPYLIGIEPIGQMKIINIISGFIALILAVSFFAYFLYYLKKGRQDHQ